MVNETCWITKANFKLLTNAQDFLMKASLNQRLFFFVTLIIQMVINISTIIISRARRYSYIH